MPLLHQAVIFSFRLDSQSVEHPRLADGKIADVDHLLHFAFALGENFPGLESDELTKLVFQLAQRVAKPAHGITPDWSRRFSPCLEGFQSARARFVVIILR